MGVSITRSTKSPGTHIMIEYVDDQGRVTEEWYERVGTFQVQEQVTSWTRECATAFWKTLKAKEGA